MPDRDKVISHFQDAIEASGKGNRWRFVRVDIIEDAIELLKEWKQEKVKVVYSMMDTECGNCGCYLDKTYSVCPKCGKRLNWNAGQE